MFDALGMEKVFWMFAWGFAGVYAIGCIIIPLYKIIRRKKNDI